MSKSRLFKEKKQEECPQPHQVILTSGGVDTVVTKPNDPTPTVTVGYSGNIELVIGGIAINLS